MLKPKMDTYFLIIEDSYSNIHAMNYLISKAPYTEQLNIN